MSRAHRWPGDDTPLSGFHGGTAAAARLAVKLAAGAAQPRKQQRPKNEAERERAVAIAKAQLEQLLSKLPPVPVPLHRRDRVRAKPRLAELVDTATRKRWLRTHRAAQGDRCHYCGCPMARNLPECENWRRPTLDHVVPLSAGGADSFENTVAACFGCNNSKGAMPENVFRDGIRAFRQAGGFP